MWSPPAFHECPIDEPDNYSVCHESSDYALVKLNVSFANWMQIGYYYQSTTYYVLNTAGYPSASQNLATNWSCLQWDAIGAVCMCCCRSDEIKLSLYISIHVLRANSAGSVSDLIMHAAYM